MKLLALGLVLLFQDAPLPALTGRVVDEAGVLSASERDELTERLARLERESTVQIVVATVRTIGDEPIEDYSIRLAEAWKIGQAATDNGIIILVVPSERKVRIEVGYGLEAVIPDGLAGRIIRERMAPAFREGDYYRGITAAVDGLELAARREYPDAAPSTAARRPALDLGALFFGFLIVGVLGNALGVLAGAVGGAVVLTVFGGGLLGWWSVPVGALLGLFAVLMLRGSGRRGGWTYHPSSGGGRGRGGWGGGGGGFGGGGFSGGGGGFGGGGASGSW